MQPVCANLTGLPVFQPSPAGLSTLAILLLRLLPCRVPSSQLPGWAPYCRPQFSSYSCRVALDTVGTSPPAAAVVPRSSARIGYVRYGAALDTRTRTCAATPTSRFYCFCPKQARMTRGRSRSTGQPRQNGRMAVPRVYLPVPAPSPSPYVPTYISPLPSLCEWMRLPWSSTCLLFFILVAVCSLFCK